jgi:protein gp37
VSTKTGIEWTDTTWNPTVGCSRVSAGCDNCYAFELHDRRRYVPNLKAARAAGFRAPAAARRAGAALPFPAQYDLPFSRVQLLAERIEDPLHWRRPRRIFVDSMADLFHPEVPDRYLDRVFEVMERADWHVYQILTKRPERMHTYVSARYAGALAPSHIWLGTSVEDERVLARVDELRATPARVRFLSCEPLIGSLARISLEAIHSVIAGGESGRRRRDVEPSWIRELRDSCIRRGVAFFFKQWGGITPKAGGRELDGETWDQMPALEV